MNCGHTYTTVVTLQSHILSFHEERRPFMCEHTGCGKTFAMKQSLSRHAVVCDPDKKKIKVRPSSKKGSLASTLSGYPQVVSPVLFPTVEKSEIWGWSLRPVFYHTFVLRSTLLQALLSAWY
uniref:C2H2-type domain-containing protein n=1 Tax=Bos indicus x Bos taurus TaxID=30522 RepID=A0A4W2CY74_BOBOX